MAMQMEYSNEDNSVNIATNNDRRKDLTMQSMKFNNRQATFESNEATNPSVMSSIVCEEDEEIKQLNKNVDRRSPIVEVDEEQQHDLPSQSLTLHFQRVLHTLTPTPPHRIRQDSGCSSTNSIRHVQFVPPCSTTVQGRRVIHSILLNVQRKKVMFEKVVNTLKDVPSAPTMYELGLEFLRLYDGKFNYPQGHTFVMLFRKRTWFLTIANIKCIECYIGQCEPRSVLILKYKNQFTSVQV